MSQPVLSMANVTKKYGTTTALDDISLNLEAGQIYALLGENGAGKTTFMRAVAGLCHVDSGELSLFGGRGEKELRQMRGLLGSLIEAPAIFQHLTVLENLNLHRIACGIPGQRETEEMIGKLNLNSVKNKKAKTLSLGTKQRLGIAMALINRPKLLLLDEPMNGLDPEGIQDVRYLLRSLNEEYGVTIIISSHVLPEVYRIATEYYFIHKGKIVEHLSKAELDTRCRDYLLLETDDTEKCATVIEEKLHTRNYRVMGERVVYLFEYIDERKYVASTMAKSGVLLTGLSVRREPLDSFYFSVIGGGAQ